jgi:hypothetical protein
MEVDVPRALVDAARRADEREGRPAPAATRGGGGKRRPAPKHRR